MSVIVGDQTGLVKVVTLGSLAPRKLKNGQVVHASTSSSKIAAKFGTQARGQGVAQMCWTGLRGREEQFAVLRDNGVIEVWSPGESALVPVLSAAHPFEVKVQEKPVVAAPVKAPAKPGKKQKPPTSKELVAAKVPPPPPKPPSMIGLGSICSQGRRRLVSASADGAVCVSQLTKGFKAEQHTIQVGSDMWGFDLAPDQKHFAVGGREQLLRLWDLETSNCSWKARNMPHDWLQLAVPEWIRAIRHRPRHPTHLFTANAHHKLRLYDVNAGRRPVLEFCPNDRPLLTLCTTPDPNYVITGDSIGTLMLIDVRKNGQHLGAYRGSGGALRDIAHHPSPAMPVIASVGLDRFLKIHHTVTRRLIKKIYLKQKLNCVLFSEETPSEDQAEEGADVWAELDRRAGLKNPEVEGKREENQSQLKDRKDTQNQDQNEAAEDHEDEADSASEQGGHQAKQVAQDPDAGREEDEAEGDEDDEAEGNEGDEDEGDEEDEDEDETEGAEEGDEGDDDEDFFKHATHSISFQGMANKRPPTSAPVPPAKKRAR